MNFAKIRIPEKWRDMRGSSQKKLKNREEKKFCLRQFPRADFRALDHQLEKENLQQPPLISFEILIIRHFLSLPTRWGYRCSLTSFWHFPPNFCPIKSDLSVGNTVWPQASGFQSEQLFAFLIFVHSKCKHSSLRSQCFKMRLFRRISYTVASIR